MITTNKYTMWTLSEFLAAPCAERQYILFPIIPVNGIAMIYAPRGIGKTYLALSLALAVASGSNIFCWKSPKPHKILIIDGEMDQIDLQIRLRGLLRGMNLKNEAVWENLGILPATAQQFSLPNLADSKAQTDISDFAGWADLIILDNLVTLCRAVDENSVSAFMNIQQWCIDMRRQGKAVLIIHHSGKDGNQRGSSAHEDILDCSIKLSRPEGYKASDGAKFVVEYMKARHFAGQDAQSFEARLHTTGSMSNNDILYGWNWDYINPESLETENESKVRQLSAEGKSLREISDLTKVPRSTIHNWLNKQYQ